MKYLFYLLLICVGPGLYAQTVGDSAAGKPRHLRQLKPVPKKPFAVQIPVATTDSSADQYYGHLPLPFGAKKALGIRQLLAINPFFPFFRHPENRVAQEHGVAGSEAMFYLLAGLLLFFALIKLFFARYMSNLLGLVFRGSLRQKQIREQLLQTPLPSLLLNMFFVVVAGLYIFFLLRHYERDVRTPFWLLLIYCVLGVAVIYVLKFIGLKLTGWIFNMRDAADTYIFIVFLVNKLLAIFLLPFLIVMAFSISSWFNVLVTLSYVMVGCFFAYRYIVSFSPVRREVKVSQFHFFMYLCAFEIVPLLLMYKLLIRYF